MWFAGLVGQSDFDDLIDKAECKGEILFPGVLMGWNTKEKALSYLGTQGLYAKISSKKVIYHAKTKVVSVACQLATYRYSARV